MYSLSQESDCKFHLSTALMRFYKSLNPREKYLLRLYDDVEFPQFESAYKDERVPF